METKAAAAPYTHIQPAAGPSTSSHRHTDTHTQRGVSVDPQTPQSFRPGPSGPSSSHLGPSSHWHHGDTGLQPLVPPHRLSLRHSPHTHPRTQDRAPRLGKRLEMGFSERPGQTALVTHRARPGRCTDQPQLAQRPALFVPLSCCFPTHSSPKHRHPPFTHPSRNIP